MAEMSIVAIAKEINKPVDEVVAKAHELGMSDITPESSVSTKIKERISNYILTGWDSEVKIFERKLGIANFRNIGINEEAELELNSNLVQGGDLIILCGENNIGKSNVLDAIKAFGDRQISDNDKPNFIGYESNIPNLKLHLRRDGREEVISVPYMEKNTQENNSAFPNIILYEEQVLQDSDLSIEPANVKNSKLFPSLCSILGDREGWLEKIIQNYGTSKRRELSKNINEYLKNTVSKRFNEHYYNSNKNEIYSFELGLEKNVIEFFLFKNNKSLKLSQQSIGFKWFFNFFFNFLYSQSFGKGDIVLIDEFGGSLSIPAQRDLRKFLKDYARQSGITFIISTHSPFLVDMDYLDELRIIRQKDNISSEVVNNFSFGTNEVDGALYQIKQAFGVQHLWELKRFIFVEGITDYNYLTKFKLLYETEKGKGLDFAFVPINGLGKIIKGKTTKQEYIIKTLPQLAKANKDNFAILIVDNDYAGNTMKGSKTSNEETLKNDEVNNNNKGLKVIALNEIFDKNNNITSIESLFSVKDKENLGKKSELNSKRFKYSDQALDTETKNNFYKLFDRLLECINK